MSLPSQKSLSLPLPIYPYMLQESNLRREISFLAQQDTQHRFTPLLLSLGGVGLGLALLRPLLMGVHASPPMSILNSNTYSVNHFGEKHEGGKKWSNIRSSILLHRRVQSISCG